MVNRTPTEMERRVASAINDAELDEWPVSEHELNLAHAAGRAMRNPTTEMLREALIGIPVSTEVAATLWGTMIDIAFPPEPEHRR